MVVRTLKFFSAQVENSAYYSENCDREIDVEIPAKPQQYAVSEFGSAGRILGAEA